MYFNFSTTAKILNRSKRTLRREMERRLIKYLDYGRDKLFLPEDLNDYIERKTVHTKKFLKRATTEAK
jgi:hypothetical protein